MKERNPKRKIHMLSHTVKHTMEHMVMKNKSTCLSDKFPFVFLTSE